MKKVLKKINGKVTHENYTASNNEQDINYYYVVYSSAWNENKMFTVSTNSDLFEEKKVVFESNDKDEAVRIAYIINKTLRLFAGYYDNSPDKDSRFPIIK